MADVDTRQLEREVLELVAQGRPLGEILASIREALARLDPTSTCRVDISEALEVHRDVAPPEASLSWEREIFDPGGTVLGHLRVYHHRPRSPSSTEDSLTEQMVRLAALAITRQRELDALRESEARFRAASKASTDAIWDWDLVRGTIWHDESYLTIFGWSDGDEHASLEHWLSRVDPADRERVAESLRAAIADGREYWEEDYRYIRPDGSVAEVNDCGYLVTDERGRPVRFVGGMTDVTQRQIEHRQLTERMKELRCLYQVLEITTREGTVLHDVCSEIAALLPESLFHDTAAVARVVLGDEEYTDPTWRAPVVTLRSEIRLQGDAVGFVEVGYVSGQGLAFDAASFLPEEHALLDAVAAHVARMIHQRHMSSSLVQAERLRAVGELTGGIAHDFNNLLTVVLGASEMLMEDPSLEQDARSLLTMVVSAARRGAELTQHLLAFARRQPLEPRAVDVAALIDEVLPLLRGSLGENIDVRFAREPGDLWTARVDPTQLESAVLNLCLNARDAMQGAGVLTIGVANVVLCASDLGEVDDVEPGEYVAVMVQDQGGGITDDHMPRVFEPFFTTKSDGHGTGLGLSMVYGFVKQTRGHVRIDSNPGEGTAVWLYLPRLLDDSLLERDRFVDVVDDVDETPETASASDVILVVEDDDLVRQLVASQVQLLGYRVLQASSAEEGLALLEQHPEVSLLFTDVILKHSVSGRELAERARHQRPGLRVLFTSGYSGTELGDEEGLDPDVHFLAKPYGRDILADKLRVALAPR